jgi:flagellar motor protein MotB
MARERKNEKAGAPGWMLTLGDITMLLLTFFVLLVTMLAEKTTPQLELPQEQERIQTQWRESRPGVTVDQPTMVLRALEELERKQPGTSEIFQVTQNVFVEVRVERVAEDEVELTTTLGGAFEPFPEGDWTLQPGQRAWLDVLKKWLADSEGAYVVVTGHTDTRPFDSAVRSEDGRIIPFAEWYRATAAESLAEYPERADFLLLSALRAHAVAEYLAEKRSPEDPAVPDRRIRVEARGPYEPASAAKESDGTQPLNRRVTIRIRRSRA